MKDAFRIIISCILLFWGADARAIIIKLKVSKSCQFHLLKIDRDTDEILTDSMKIALSAGDKIKFVIENNAISPITLMLSDMSNVRSMTLNNNFLKAHNTFATDEALELRLADTVLDFSESFALIALCKNSSVTCNFEVDVKEVGNSLLSNLNISNNDKLDEQKKVDERSQEPYEPGSMVNDALKLANNKTLKHSEFVNIAAAYFPDILTDSDAVNAFSRNRFLTSIIKDVNYPQGKEKGKAQSAGGGMSSLSFSSIGGLDVTNIADGFAKFIVKRTKEELNIAFFSKFKTVLNDTNLYNKDLKTLFPNTWNLLNAIGDEIYDYQKYLQNLREVFQSDIKTLDENLPGIIPHHQPFFNAHFELSVSLNSACYITHSLKTKVHPGDIIDNYPINYFNKDGVDTSFNKNWSGALQTLQLISESMRNNEPDDNNYWVSIKQVRDLVNNKKALIIYLGLLYQTAGNKRYNNIEYSKGSFIGLLDQIDVKNFDKDYLTYKNFIADFGTKVHTLNEMINTNEKPANDSLAVELYAKYFKSTLELIQHCTKVSELPYFNKITGFSHLSDTLSKYFEISYEVSDLATDINKKNYSSAINHLVNIYNIIVVKPIQNELDSTRRVITQRPLTRKQKKAVKKYFKAIEAFNPAFKSKIRPHLIDSLLHPLDTNTRSSIKKAIENAIDTTNLSISDSGSTAKARIMQAVKSVIDLTILPSLKTDSAASAKIKMAIENSLNSTLLTDSNAADKIRVVLGNVIDTTILSISNTDSIATARIKKALENTIDTITVSLSKNAMQKLTDSILNPNINSTLPITSAIVNDSNLIALTSSKQVMQKLVRYGSLMSIIATAKTSDEVESAIETFALPSGSARIKRESAFNVSLNAYSGLYLGGEMIKGLDTCYKLNSWGITAPIGIAVSWGKVVGQSSITLFASIVDLGAVTAFRFTNDSADAIPTVQLRDIISPGIFISYGIGKTPLSVNFGYQTGPRLRKVSETLNDIAEDRYGRISLSICVDIPIFNFYTKP